MADSAIQTTVTSDEIRETFRDFFVARDHKRLPSGSLVPATYDPSVLLTTAGMHPLKPYFLGQEPRRTSASRLPEVLSLDRHREGREHAPPPHVLRDARQLLDRRLLQAGRGRAGLGAVARGLRLRPRADLDHGPRAATRRWGSVPTRRRSRRGRASACPGAHRPAGPRRTTSGRPGPRAPAAPARSSISTADRSSAATTTARGTTPSGSSSTGTSSSCSTTRTRRARSPRCPARTSTRAWASTAWRRSSRTSPPSTRRTSSSP